MASEAETHQIAPSEGTPSENMLEAGDTLVEAPVGEPCAKCGIMCSLDSGAVQKGQNLHCNTCVNLYQLLYRHMGGLPPALQALSADAQIQFFKASGSIVKSAPKNSRWKLVKQQLSTSLVTYHTEQRRCRVNEKRLPLTAWAARGFDVEKVKSNGTKFEDEAGIEKKNLDWPGLNICSNLFV